MRSDSFAQCRFTAAASRKDCRHMEMPIRWHAEARRMRAQGHGARKIAALVGKSHSAVKWVFSQGKPAAPAGPATTRKPSPRPGAPADKAAKPARRPSAPSSPALSAGARLVESHAPRAIRVTIDERALAVAAADFAAGKIDGAELMRRITR